MTEPLRHRFGVEEFNYWTTRLVPWFDPFGPAGQHLLSGRKVNVTMQVGLYVGIKEPDLALYAGKVRRADGGVDARFASHRQAVDSWDAVWLIPLRSSASDQMVRFFELELIRHHRPLHNVLGVVK